ncbi:MAG: tyrosine-type recombinase/integrase [Lachnospiraceae bacterium]|nr:tyrosine-type recombinase/integrase [Lachnospiraceae bacterium]
MERNYHEQMNIKNELHLRELIKELPKFSGEFFRGIEPTTSSRTRIAYAFDLGIFFHFLQEQNSYLKDKPIPEWPIGILDQIKAVDIEEFLSWLRFYVKDGKEITNDEQARKRKLIALRSFYTYFYKKERITTNPAILVDIPKTHQKEIIRLDIDEVAKLLDEVESGEDLSDRQKAFHDRTKVRDLAMMTLLLGTGIRVSECVGLNISDVDFNNNGIKVRRKGGSEAVVYFGDEVREALEDYLIEREKIIPCSGHEDALFLSLQNKRMGVRTVEKMVKKYAGLVTSLKKITPHKLRSTYGTNLYRATGDIYLVADVLGHKDVNTTRRHYAALEEDRRRSAANIVKLRKEE